MESTTMDKMESENVMAVDQDLKDSDQEEEALTILQKTEIPDLKLEPRATYLHLGAVSSVKGSAYMEYGNTKVLAMVAPPREMTRQTKKAVNIGVVVCDVKFASCTLDDPTMFPRKESTMCTSIRKALEPAVCRSALPYCQLDVKVLVLDDDGCVLSTAINCCGAALVQAGLPVFDIVTASTACLFKGKFFVNPNASVERLIALEGGTEEEEYGTVVLASLPKLNQVAGCSQSGYLSYEAFTTLVEHAITVNRHMLTLVNETMVQMVTKRHEKQDERREMTRNQVERIALALVKMEK